MNKHEAWIKWRKLSQDVLEAEFGIDKARLDARDAHTKRTAFLHSLVETHGDEFARDVVTGRVS